MKIVIADFIIPNTKNFQMKRFLCLRYQTQLVEFTDQKK